MTTFGKAPRPHTHTPRPVTADVILSHEKEHATFRPSLPKDGWRDKVESSAYGRDYSPPKAVPKKEPSETEVRAAFKPNLKVSKNQAILKDIAQSSRYGQKTVQSPHETRAKNADKLRPKPTFQPQINEGRLQRSLELKESARSSGYAGSETYRPGPAKRGEVLRKMRPELDQASKYTFKPQLCQTKKAQELRKVVAEKYPQGKRVEQDQWHARQREARVYSPRKWVGSPPVITSKSLQPYTDASVSYDTGGFILDAVAFGTRGSESLASGFSTGGYRGAHLDVDMLSPTGRPASPLRARPKTTEYDINGRPKGEPIFDPSSIAKQKY